MWKLIPFLLLSLSCFASDIYVAQTSTGAASGSNCSNAISLASLNSGVGQSVGNTIHFCGTITGIVSVTASGSAGNVLTFTAEAGSSFTAASWSGAIFSHTGNLAYIRWTGLTAICTNCGTGKNSGVSFISITGVCDHCEIDHNSVTNMYVRTANSGSRGPVGININWQGFNANMSSLSIHDNTLTWFERAATVDYTNGSNYSFYNNYCAHVASCVWYGDPNVNFQLNDLDVYGNEVYDTSAWTDPTDIGIHCDGLIHAFSAASNTAILNLKIHDNYAHGPSCGARMTAWIYIENTNNAGSIPNAQVYNNLLDTSLLSDDGLIYLKHISNPKVFHNTVHQASDGYSSLEFCDVQGATVENNIFQQVGGKTIFDETGVQGVCTASTVSTVDYNDSFGNASTDFGPGAHSISSDPLLDASLVPASGSPVRGAGIDVSASCAGCATSKNSQSRPPWDIGALSFVAASAGRISVKGKVRGTIK